DQKTTSQANLDGLKNLNDAQKDAFVQSIDNASTPQLVEQALAEAKKVDAEMARLRRELALVDGTKNSVKYTNADTKLRDNYDSLVKVALDLISKDGIDANLATVQELVNELNAARLSLNGKFVETQEVVIDNTTSQNKTQKNRSVVNKSTLPQTGDKEENSSLVGVAFITIAGVLGLGLARRRKEDK
ncbi:LPXTG cell wall anchor domain-containing protein, partial [Ligilactobacillus sp. MP3]|uniref:LPXTG cell wall anchor domain-containing protein n=1 Tax=Ligilactobacillus sp. MP3 TaxID=2965103 RepID=UPI00210B03C2